MPLVDFISPLHRATTRDYLARVNDPDFPKAKAATMAKKWGVDYWDGDRRTGYGGMRYDGRWLPVAKALVKQYQLTPQSRVLDIGCGKGFLLHDLTLAMPGIKVTGLDISDYAIENSVPEVREQLVQGCASELPFTDNAFDLVLSINTLHNLPCPQLHDALKEIGRVGNQNRYVCVESFRNEEEKANLLYWQLTCECFFSPEEWQWWFERTGYQGDHSFIYFE